MSGIVSAHFKERKGEESSIESKKAKVGSYARDQVAERDYAV